MISAALYARYSSDRQRTESIAAQLRYGKDFCHRHGYTVARIYKDEAMTGTNDHRQGFQKMLADARHGLFDVAIIHKCDRFGRDEYDYYTNKAKLERCGVKVEYTGQNFDPNTPEGRLMENQLVGLAAYYSRNLSGEVKKGQRENAYEGKSTNGSLAYGYMTDNKKYVIIDEHKAAAVRYVYQSYADGASYKSIKLWLSDHGYKTARGADFTSTSLHDMLVNPRYIGTSIIGRNVPFPDGRRNSHREIHEGCTVVKDAHPAIISKELFAKVAERMEKNRRRTGSYTAKSVYLLSGLVVCGECGSSYVGGCTHKGHSDYKKRYYRCSKRQRYTAAACSNTAVGADDLESLVTKRMFETIKSPDFMDRLVKKVAAAYESLCDTSKDELPALLVRQKKLRSALSNLYGLIEDGVADEYDKERIGKVKLELREADALIDEINQRKDLPHISEATIRKYINKKFSSYIQKNSADNNIRAILENFVDRIVISKDTITIRYKFVLDWCDWGRTMQEQTGITYDDIFPRRLLAC